MTIECQGMHEMIPQLDPDPDYVKI